LASARERPISLNMRLVEGGQDAALARPRPPQFVDVFSVDPNLAGPDGAQALPNLPLERRGANVEG
jgi:hypothetical protein